MTRFKQDNVVFGPQDAAEYLTSRGWRVSKSKLQRLRINGCGPAFSKVGQEVIYKKSALEEFMLNLPEYKNTSEQKAVAAA